MYRSIFYGIILTLLFVLGSLIYIVKKTLTKDFLGVFVHIDKRYLILSLLSMIGKKA